MIKKIGSLLKSKKIEMPLNSILKLNQIEYLK